MTCNAFIKGRTIRKLIGRGGGGSGENKKRNILAISSDYKKRRLYKKHNLALALPYVW